MTRRAGTPRSRVGASGRRGQWVMPIAPYGSWKSPISSDLIVAQSIGLSEVRIDRGDVYWLESRPQERGRAVVVLDGRELTPSPFNVRTRIHEYGGGAWTV